MLLRLAYLGVSNVFAVLRLLPMGDREKDMEILALRHQITVLERQLEGQRVRFTAGDRAFLAALLYQLPPQVLRRVRLLVQPETVLRWHRDLVARRHAARSTPCASSNSSTTPTDPTRASATTDPCVPCRRRSRIRSRSPASTYENAPASAASFTSMSMRHDLHG